MPVEITYVFNQDGTMSADSNGGYSTTGTYKFLSDNRLALDWKSWLADRTVDIDVQSDYMKWTENRFVQDFQRVK